MAKVEHFDATALLKAVYDQPLGLCISTNHPDGFRRLLYLHQRQNPTGPKVKILQSPKSANAFYLVKENANG